MSAYVVVHANILDQNKLEEYAGAAGKTVEAHGGRFLCRGPSTTLAGDSHHQVMVVLEFPDRATAQAWYDSSDYQALIPTRKAAMDAVFVLGGE